MKTFFETHRIYHKTLEERHAVIELVKQHLPDVDLHYWGDRWAPNEWPYMQCDTDLMHCSLYSTRGGDMIVSAQEFIAMFREEETDDADMDAIFALV